MSHPNSKVWNGTIDEAFALDQENPFLGQTEDYIKSFELKGGQGSGNFGHSGRPGEIGGSGRDSGVPSGDAAEFERNLSRKEHFHAQEEPTSGSRDKGIQIGDRVYIKKEYGGGVGEVTDIAPSGSFLIVEKRKGLTTHEFSLHESDVLTKTEKRQAMSPAVNIKTPKEKRGTGFKLNPNKSQLKANIEDRFDEIESEKALKGGQGSGNFGHRGRPGEIGGSQDSSSKFQDDLNATLAGVPPKGMFNYNDFVHAYINEKMDDEGRTGFSGPDEWTKKLRLAQAAYDKFTAVQRAGSRYPDLLNEYVKDAHNDDGYSFWDNFSTKKEAISDFNLFRKNYVGKKSEKSEFKSGEGVWRTIRGSRVFIEDGKITKGPKNLVGKTNEQASHPGDSKDREGNVYNSSDESLKQSMKKEMKDLGQQEFDKVNEFGHKEVKVSLDENIGSVDLYYVSGARGVLHKPADLAADRARAHQAAEKIKTALEKKWPLEDSWIEKNEGSSFVSVGFVLKT